MCLVDDKKIEISITILDTTARFDETSRATSMSIRLISVLRENLATSGSGEWNLPESLSCRVAINAERNAQGTEMFN